MTSRARQLTAMALIAAVMLAATSQVFLWPDALFPVAMFLAMTLVSGTVYLAGLVIWPHDDRGES